MTSFVFPYCSRGGGGPLRPLFFNEILSFKSLASSRHVLLAETRLYLSDLHRGTCCNRRSVATPIINTRKEQCLNPLLQSKNLLLQSKNLLLQSKGRAQRAQKHTSCTVAAR